MDKTELRMKCLEMSCVPYRRQLNDDVNTAYDLPHADKLFNFVIHGTVGSEPKKKPAAKKKS